MTDTWHVPYETLSAWVSGRISATIAASVERHLTACAGCRSRVAESTEAQQVLHFDRIWTGIADRVEPPSAPPLGRLMKRSGMAESDAILLGAASAFTASWVAATATVVALTFLMSILAPASALPVYLLLAPLVPVAGVAAAYGEEVDPTYELSIAAPYPQLRLLLLRSIAVVVVSVPLTVLAGVLLRPWWIAVAWLAPGLAFVLLLLAATTWWSPSWAVGAIAILWAVASAGAYRTDHILALVGVLVDLVSAAYASAAFVLLGPLLPIAGVGLSYAPSVTGDYQLVVASPYSTVRLLLLRAALFLALAAPVLLFCGHRLDGVQFGARVLVHAAAVDAVGLAQSTLSAPTLSGAVVSLVWMVLVGDLADITSLLALVLAACAVMAALFVFVVRRRALSTDWRYS